ncbi:MAG: DNA polymerase III subunit beta [Paludibacteraceae bacterium]
MKFTVSSTELLSHLQAISRVINSKNSLQILDNFLLSLEGNKLTMTASDIETTMITSMEVQDVDGSGAVAVSNKLILDTLREFSEQPLTFYIDDDTLALVVTSVNGTYNFIGQNGDMYPQIPQLEDNVNHLTVSVSGLLSGISKTFFSMADDELRPVMNGIYFDISSDLTLVATDAHKLVRFKTSYESASVNDGESLNFILPKKPATMLRNILPKESGSVEIKFDEKNAYFGLSNYTMVCRQVEGRYPNYNGVIPKNNPFKVIVDRATLLNTLKRVSVFSNQASNLIKLDFTTNQVHVSAQDIDFSISAEEFIPCQYEGEPIKIGFKSTFLIEMLGNVDSNEVVLELADPSRAGILIPLENSENEDILMLLMPMLLND